MLLAAKKWGPVWYLLSSQATLLPRTPRSARYTRHRRVYQTTVVSSLMLVHSDFTQPTQWCVLLDDHTIALVTGVLRLSVHTCETCCQRIYFQLIYDSTILSNSSNGYWRPIYLVNRTAVPCDIHVKEHHLEIVLLTYLLIHSAKNDIFLFVSGQMYRHAHRWLPLSTPDNSIHST